MQAQRRGDSAWPRWRKHPSRRRKWGLILALARERSLARFQGRAPPHPGWVPPLPTAWSSLGVMPAGPGSARRAGHTAHSKARPDRPGLCRNRGTWRWDHSPLPSSAAAIDGNWGTSPDSLPPRRGRPWCRGRRGRWRSRRRRRVARRRCWGGRIGRRRGSCRGWRISRRGWRCRRRSVDRRGRIGCRRRSCRGRRVGRWGRRSGRGRIGRWRRRCGRGRIGSWGRIGPWGCGRLASSGVRRRGGRGRLWCVGGARRYRRSRGRGGRLGCIGGACSWRSHGRRRGGCRWRRHRGRRYHAIGGCP